MKKLTAYKNSLRTEVTKKNFYAFFVLIFSESVRKIEGEFKNGSHFKKWCNQLQNDSQTSRVSARKFAKSHVFYAFVMWLMWKMDDPGFLKRFYYGLYFSYTGDLAEKHLKNINRYIEVNSYFKPWIKQTTGETSVHYAFGTGEEKKEFKIEAAGILEFNRGEHTDVLLCDDILRDPENEMNIEVITKITRKFKEEIMSIPKEGSILHVAGTKQDEQDIFAELEKDPSFKSYMDPAIVDEANQISLWPEMFPYSRLEEIRKSIGNKAFQREYMCIPVRSSNAFFGRQELLIVVKKDLPFFDPYEFRPLDAKLYDVRAGFDIGKKQHPSHLSVLEKRENLIIQICSFWMDGWAYTKQIEFLKEAIKNLHIDIVVYDNTRGEFEALEEMGDLPGEMVPVTFTKKLKNAVATTFEKAVQNERIHLLNDPRQFRQILNCDNNLASVETPEGHGDSFWSNALAIHSFESPDPEVRYL